MILCSLFHTASHDFQQAANMDENSCGPEGLKRAQRLEKQSQKRDYYKILGVKRSAQKREILKAYRKLAQKWHPDNYQGDSKKEAEKKFIDIAAAKEVLTDPGQCFSPFLHCYFVRGPSCWCHALQK